jgi:hypothetical protein
VSEPGPRRYPRVLSRRARAELGALQAELQQLSVQRAAALRMLVASRHAATTLAQREFWLEFAWADQEYRIAVLRMAQFCAQHRDGTPRTAGRVAAVQT